MSGAWRHLSADELDALGAGLLSDEAAGRAAAHLDACPRCAAAARAVDPLQPALMTVEAAPCPADLIAALLASPAMQPAPAVTAAAPPPLATHPAEPPAPRWPALLAAAGLVAAAALSLQITGELGQTLSWARAGVFAAAALSRTLGLALGAPVWLIALELPLLGAFAYWAHRQRALRPVV